MTKKELSQLYYLRKEINREQKRLEELSASSHITGLPHIGELSSGTAIEAEIADTKALIEAKTKASVAEYNRLIRYINSIEDSFTRQVFVLRYVDGYSWGRIAREIGGNTADSIRMAHNRFLRDK